MGSQSWILLSLVFLSIASACDEDACQAGFAAGTAGSCAAGAVGGVASAFACTVGAIFTFGASCAVALGVTAVGAGLCGGLSAGSSSGSYFH